MSEATLPRFACEGCAKSYKWKPELTNKKVQCKCGAVMRVPDLTPPAADEPAALPDDDIFDLIDNAPTGTSQAQRLVAAAAAEPPAPKVKQSARGAAAVATLAGPARGGPPILGYRGGPTLPQRQQAARGSVFYDLKHDVYLPTALIAGSMLAYFAWLMVNGNAGGRGTLAVYGLFMFATFALKTFLMILGAFIVAPLAGVSFGPFWTAILKLAAVTIAPDVLVTIIEQAINVPGGGFLAGIVGLACYWALMSWLFHFEAADAFAVVILFGVLRWFLTAMCMVLLMGYVFSGGSFDGVGGGGGSAATVATQEAIDFDETVAEMKENSLTEEGLAYIQRTGRQSGKVESIKRIYAAGAKDISFTLAKDINGKTEPLSLAIEWPRDKKKRAAVLAAINESLKLEAVVRSKNMGDGDPTFKITAPVLTDEGGKYIEYPVGH